jgi:hypothetical protein
MNGLAYKQLTLFQEASPANLFPWLESKKVKGTTVTSGRKCSELSENLAQVGLLVRTYLESCELPGKQFVRTWSVRDTLSPYLILKLRLSERRTEGTDASLWATPNTMDHLPQRSAESLLRQAETTRKRRTRPANLREQVDPEVMRMWPTPTTQEIEHPQAELTETGRRKTKDGKNSHSLGLADAVKMWPTPIADDAKNVNPKPNRIAGLCSAVKDCEGTGSLNPTWVEWLQGFPIGWTDIGE